MLYVCAFHLKDAGSSGNTLQYAGLIAVLQEDGSVVVNILHLNKYRGCACSPTACWTVVYVQTQINTSVRADTRKLRGFTHQSKVMLKCV